MSNKEQIRPFIDVKEFSTRKLKSNKAEVVGGRC